MEQELSLGICDTRTGVPLLKIAFMMTMTMIRCDDNGSFQTSCVSASLLGDIICRPISLSLLCTLGEAKFRPYFIEKYPEFLSHRNQITKYIPIKSLTNMLLVKLSHKTVIISFHHQLR